ncbi:hypothetical protein [uncultured Arcticibacterium sp.]|uniref:hypothetical protein n=1 Tax=uncultured Arcticibacterium sp. TaxID=2173042 RepID=UPI0030F619B3
MKKVTLIITLFSTFYLSSCDSVSPKLESDLVIISGQSFGECQGECTQYFELNAQNDSVSFVSQPYYVDNAHEKKIFKGTLEETSWQEILSELNTKTFRNLNEVYGCPDCADGGAEWIEITDSSGVHKVTFEYGQEVKGIENLIILLRNQRNALSKKYLSPI